MKTKIVFFLLGISLGLTLTPQAGYAAYSDSQGQREARYVLLVPSGISTYAKGSNRKSPALVLDTYQGIVWKCPDLQDEKVRWFKADLVDSPAPGLRTRYVGIISDVTGNEVKIAAVVLDTEEGKTWVCADIASEESKWQLTSLAEKPKPNEVKVGIWQ